MATIEVLESNMNTISTQLKKGLTMSAGGAKTEAAYGIAYQALVQAGARPQLRKKYRL